MKCPWCENSIDFPAQLGTRPTKDSPKWYKLSLSGSYKTVNVCPYCSGAVKITTNSQLWFILVFPVLITLIAQLLWSSLFGSTLVLPKFIVPSLGVLAIFGAIMCRFKMQLEKSNEI